MLQKDYKIFVDALSIVSMRMSGIGHNTSGLIKALGKLPEVREHAQIYLIVPLWKKKFIQRHRFSPNVKIKVLPLPARFIALLLRLHLMPPVDLLLGKGTYIFPNYRNWPLLGSKSYTYIHDTVFMRYPQFVQPKNLTYLKKYVPLWIKRADKIITLSEFSKTELIRYLQVPKAKIIVVSPGVDSSVFYQKDEEEIEKMKQKYNLYPRPYILYLGNIEPRKNLIRLVRAFNMLPMDIKSSYDLLLVGGDGWLSEEINNEIKKARANGSSIVKPKEYIVDSDLPALLSGASLLAHPALYEGFGISPLQAMACGTPVLIANNSSLPEVVGNAGVLVNAEDENDISNKIQAILTNSKLSKIMISEGLNQAQKFKWETSAKKLLHAIQEESIGRPALHGK